MSDPILGTSSDGRTIVLNPDLKFTTSHLTMAGVVSAFAAYHIGRLRAEKKSGKGNAHDNELESVFRRLMDGTEEVRRIQAWLNVNDSDSLGTFLNDYLASKALTPSTELIKKLRDIDDKVAVLRDANSSALSTGEIAATLVTISENIGDVISKQSTFDGELDDQYGRHREYLDSLKSQILSALHSIRERADAPSRSDNELSSLSSELLQIKNMVSSILVLSERDHSSNDAGQDNSDLRKELEALRALMRNVYVTKPLDAKVVELAIFGSGFKDVADFNFSDVPNDLQFSFPQVVIPPSAGLAAENSCWGVLVERDSGLARLVLEKLRNGSELTLYVAEVLHGSLGSSCFSHPITVPGDWRVRISNEQQALCVAYALFPQVINWPNTSNTAYEQPCSYATSFTAARRARTGDKFYKTTRFQTTTKNAHYDESFRIDSVDSELGKLSLMLQATLQGTIRLGLLVG